jgi:hypothetical protein
LFSVHLLSQRRSRINAKHFAKWDFYNNQWVIMLTQLHILTSTIIIKVKKVEGSITDIIDSTHFMYMQRKEFMKEMDISLLYICLFY